MFKNMINLHKQIKDGTFFNIKQRRRYYLNYALLIVAFSLLIQGIFNSINYLSNREYSNDFFSSAIFCLVFFSLALILFIINRKMKKPLAIFWIGVILFSLAQLYCVIYENVFISNYFWIIIIPLNMIYLFGAYTGSIYSAAFMLVLIIIYVLQNNNDTQMIQFKITTLNLYMCVMLFTLFYEFIIKNILSHLTRANRQISEAERQKTNFFMNLAHETKTPLTLIQNNMEKYLKNHKAPQELLNIFNSINKLKRDMVNFFTQEKIIQGQMFYNHRQVVNFSDVLNECIELFKTTAEKKNISLRYEIADESYLKMDPHAVTSLINNLLDNAIRYTSNNGNICISLSKDKTGLTLSIADTGIGISKEQQKHIFEPYYQISHEKQNIQGMGIGLTIVKRIIDDVGGRISLKSSLNQGTIFTIRLKKHSLSEDDIIEQVDTGSGNYQPETAEHKLEEKIVAHRHNVLLVEDNREMLTYLFNSMNKLYNVFYAENGRQALDKLKQIPAPHIIISDIMMDGMDGYEFHEKLMEERNFSSVPFIFLTAKSSRDDKIKGLGKGAVDFINKPFAIDELMLKIDSLLKVGKAQENRNRAEMEKRIIKAIRSEEYADESFSLKNIMHEYAVKYDFTKREEEIFSHILEGVSNRIISERLFISRQTVKTHIYNIFKKMGVKSRFELMNLVKHKNMYQ